MATTQPKKKKNSTAQQSSTVVSRYPEFQGKPQDINAIAEAAERIREMMKADPERWRKLEEEFRIEDGY